MALELALGLIIGIVMALTGAGGGILAVPLLVFAAGAPVAQAAPIGLLAVGMAALLGALLGLRAGIVRHRAALLMALAGISLAPLGVWLSRLVDNRWLSGLFALVLFYVAWRSFRQAREEMSGAGPTGERDLPCIRSEETGRFIWTTRCARAMALAGGLAGLLSGLLGVGGGFVMVPALRRHTDLPMQSVVATALAVIALVSFTGVASNALAGGIAWRQALPFAGGALAGMLLGRLVSSRFQGARLQQGFALLAVLVAAGMAWKALA